MAGRKSSGLDADQVGELRARLAGGKRPRVAVSGSQFPLGTVGTVVRVGDAEVDGPDFVMVRLKLGNVVDELAFSPGELALPQRARRSTTAATTAPSPTAASAPVPAAEAGAAVDAALAYDAGVPNRPGRRSAKTTAAPEPTTTTAQRPEPDRTPRRSGAKGVRRGGGLSKVSVTVTSSGATWSVTAQRGARTVVKSASVPPGVVAAIAELIDDEAISAAVHEINDVALIEAAARATQLRAELAEVEALLAGHERP